MSVRIAAVCDAHDEYDEIVVPHFVEDSIVADAQSPEAPKVALERAACQWVVRQAVNGGDDAEPMGLRHPF